LTRHCACRPITRGRRGSVPPDGQSYQSAWRAIPTRRCQPPDFDPAKLLALIQKDGRHRFAGQYRVRIERAAPSLEERVALVHEFLDRLS